MEGSIVPLDWTPGPVTVPEDAELREVMGLMDRHEIKRVPVVRGEQLVGIVSRSDLMRALVQSLRRVEEVSSEDIVTRQRLSALERDYWLRQMR